jgi:primosomal protein N' (replication factor Y)
MRVQLPFGRANKRTEGVVLTVEPGDEAGLKAIERCLDEAPVLTQLQLRLAAFIRERYFCTMYDAIRCMLPAGLWFQSRKNVTLTEDRSWKEKAIRKEGARELLEHLENLGGQAEEAALREQIPEEETLHETIAYLVRKKWVSADTDFRQRIHDRTEKIATLASSPEEAMEFASHRPKSAAMQRSVLELLCGVGSVAVKELCYFTGASTATVNRLEALGYLTSVSGRCCGAGRSSRQSWRGH